MDGWEKLIEAATQTTLATIERARRLEEHRRQRQQRDTDLDIEQLRDSVDRFDHAAELAEEIDLSMNFCAVPATMHVVPVDPAEFVQVPFKCPECEARLLVEIEEWESETGLITEAGFHLQCPNESFEDRDTWHRHYQGEWQPVITKVYRWLSANVRVWRQDR